MIADDLSRRNIKPILIVGTARSGTTWLTNLLAAHPDVACPVHVVHWGAAENHLGTLESLHGPKFRSAEAMVRFVELFCASDFGRLCGTDANELSRHQPGSVREVVFAALDGHASTCSASHWVTKMDSAYLNSPNKAQELTNWLAHRYGGFTIVLVSRGFMEVASSYLVMEGSRSVHEFSAIARIGALVAVAARFVSHARVADRLWRSDHQSTAVTYDELLCDSGAVLDRICKKAGLRVHPALEPDFLPNSSYITRNKPPRWALWIGNALRFGFQAIPGTAEVVLRVWNIMRPNARDMYFRLHLLESLPLVFEQELRRQGQEGLARVLFEAKREHYPVKNGPGRL